MRSCRPVVLCIAFALGGCSGPLPADSFPLGTQRQPLLVAQVSSPRPTAGFAAALAVCPDRSVLVGLPLANNGVGDVWATAPGAPGSVSPTTLFAGGPSTRFGAALACGPGNAKVVGAPGSNNPSTVSTPPASILYGPPGVGTSVVTLRGDGGFRFAAAAPDSGVLRVWDDLGGNPVRLPSTGSIAQLGLALVAIDLDGDLRDDLIAATPTTLEIFLQRGGAFAAPRSLNLGTTPASTLAAGRLLPGNSTPVIVLGSPSLEQVALYALKSDGGTESLGVGREVDAGGFGAALAIGDFDGDGLDELMVSAPGAQRVFRYQYDSAAGTFLSRGAPIEPPVGSPTGAATGFGAALAFGDVEGDAAGELVVGAPNANNGGAFFVYRYSPEPMDSGAADAAVRDGGTFDSGAPDSGALDAGARDAGPPDSGARDAGPPDSGAFDSGAADAGEPADGGPGDAGAAGSFDYVARGCSASSSSGLGALAWLLVLARRLAPRRREMRRRSGKGC